MNSIVSGQYSMAIIDDEELIREGMKFILPWDEYGIHIVFTAENGSQAIEMAASQLPDIFLCDIRMPEMDGLSFIRETKRISPESESIIISGFNDFDYAREAIRLGAFAYVLKPIQIDELRDVIECCIKKIEITRQKKIEENCIKDKMEKVVPIARDYYIAGFLNGTSTYSANKFEELLIDIIDRYYIAFHIYFKSNKNNFNIKSNALSYVKDKVDILMKEINKGQFKWYLLTGFSELSCILSMTEDAYSDLQYMAFLNEIFKKLNDEIATIYGRHISFCVGSVVESIEDICISSEEAQKAIYSNILNKESEIIFIDKVDVNSEINKFFLSTMDRKHLFCAIETNDYKMIEEIFNNMKLTINNLEYRKTEYIYSSILEILISCARFISENGFEIQKIYDANLFSYNHLSKYDDIDELFSWLTEFIIKISNCFHVYKSGRPKRIIDEIRKYISENISQNINLNILAEKFYYNPSYISRIFKDELGKNFIDYVIEQKVELAKKMLRETNLKFYTISEMLGYKDYKYFSSIFKKTTNLTPIQYRREWCKDETT